MSGSGAQPADGATNEIGGTVLGGQVSRGRRVARRAVVMVAVLAALTGAVRAAADDDGGGSLLDLLPAGDVLSGAAMAPGTVVGGAVSLVFADGDHVVYQADAKGGGGSWDRPVDHAGFSTYGDASALPRYDLRLVSSAGIEQLRPHLERAAAAVESAGGPRLRVTAGTVAEGTKMQRGEVHVIIADTSPCSGWWLGCGGPVIDDGVVIASRIWINPRLLQRDAAQIDNTSRHELGHAMGLGHYDRLHDDRIQTMHPSSFDADGYESGDRAGLRFVTGTPEPDHEATRAPAAAGSATVRAPAPPPPPPPPPVDPTGRVEVAGSTPLGLAVGGWAVDPDSPAPVPVLVTIDGAPVETRADRPRPDGATNGFRVVRPVEPGTHEVCVMLRNAGQGSDVRIGCRAVEVSNRSIDRVGLQTV